MNKPSSSSSSSSSSANAAAAPPASLQILCVVEPVPLAEDLQVVLVFSNLIFTSNPLRCKSNGAGRRLAVFRFVSIFIQVFTANPLRCRTNGAVGRLAGCLAECAGMLRRARLLPSATSTGNSWPGGCWFARRSVTQGVEWPPRLVRGTGTVVRERHSS